MENPLIFSARVFTLSTGLLFSCLVHSQASAPSVTDDNFFLGETVNASSYFGGGYPGLASDLSALADQSAALTILTNYGGTIESLDYFSFSGTTSTTTIDTINIFDSPAFSAQPGGSREASNVAIYYTTTSTGSMTSGQLLDPANYTSVGSYALTFSQTTSGVANQDSNGNNVNYETLSGLNIPVGTTSILLGFTKSVENGQITPPADYYQGVGFTEIQAVAVVPEPSTYALLLGSAAFLIARIHRRQP